MCYCQNGSKFGKCIEIKLDNPMKARGPSPNLITRNIKYNMNTENTYKHYLVGCFLSTSDIKNHTKSAYVNLSSFEFSRLDNKISNKI